MVSNVILLKIHPGSFEQGFPVTVEIGEPGRSPHHTLTGALPPAPDLPAAYDRWWTAFHQGEPSRHSSRVIVPAQVLNVSQIQDCRDAASVFKASLLNWLDQYAVVKLEGQIHRAVQPPAQLVLQTDDPLLQRLPWELWPLLEEFDFSFSHTAKMLVEPRLQSPPEILAVLGNSDQIDTESDLQWLKQLSPDKVTVLRQPSRKDFNDALWEKNWDIFFFAGHSHGDSSPGLSVVSQANAVGAIDPPDPLKRLAQGSVMLNDFDELSLLDLSHGLKRAIKNGLTLAIINSCDGLALARQLGLVQLPYAVVMREHVPDAVAQRFLRYFLSELGAGQPLHQAMRITRERLQGDEREFPCASWLPVLCQNPAAPVLRWPRGVAQDPVAVPPSPVLPEVLPKVLSLSDLPSPVPSPVGPKGLSRRWMAGPAIALCLAGVWAFSVSSNPGRTRGTRPNASPALVVPPIQPKTSTESPHARFSDVPGLPEQWRKVNYGGGTTWAPIRHSVDKKIGKELLSFGLEYRHPENDRIPGTAAGFEMLAKGEIDFLQSSRQINSGKRDELTDKEGKKIVFEEIKVVQSFRAVAVHPSLKLPKKGLSLSEIKGICDGRITNWKDVGGPDLAIQVFDRQIENGPVVTQPSFGDQCSAARRTLVKTPTEAIQELAKTPGGFYINAVAVLVPQCSIKVLDILTSVNGGERLSPYQEAQLATALCEAQPPRVNLETLRNPAYPDDLHDDLYVVVRKDGSDGEAVGRFYAALLQTGQGRSLLEEAGFLAAGQQP